MSSGPRGGSTTIDIGFDSERELAMAALFVRAGLIDETTAAAAIEQAEATRSPVESVLIATGAARRLAVYHALAEAWELEFADLSTEQLEPDLAERFTPELLVAEGWFPMRRTGDDRFLVATAVEPDDEHRARVEAHLGAAVRFVATTTWDIDHAILRGARRPILDQASMGLWERNRLLSARTVLVRDQKIAVAVAVLVLVVGLVLWPRIALAVVSTSIATGFLASVAFKFFVCLRGARLERAEAITSEEVAALSDDDLPVYTVLVPVFREANVVGDLVANLSALDYPKEKLQILLLLEEDDVETREAAIAARPPETITFVTVPRGQPQTKPKACNVGLFLARGDLLVIYDAEDRPDPDQLKKAVIAFQRGNDDLVCVQAALNYWNVDDNVLTRMFTLEYSFWFDYMLPGLEATRMPIPLGGTSNHFRTDRLRELGGWDPFNVTEDADLGIRASALGYTVGVINSTTFEEANNHYGNFVRQRSRWIKGYLQTMLVHGRQPGRLVREAGAKQTAGFALLVGGTPLSFLCVPPLYALFAVSIVLSPDALAPYFPSWVLWASLVNLLIGNILMVYVGMMGAFKRKRYRLVPWALLNPVYWLLHSIASYKALWQLIRKPHYWEKTLHGLSSAHAAGVAGAGRPVGTPG
jgi:cellulose synthase/poly-beta-1,6-N-acetylglucosamine synthase-like glycosyltransferase